MPRLGGRELQEMLVDDGYQIPIIILTAHGNEQARAWASRAGVVAFLHKPFDTETLLGAVESALNR
jgi:FixJ family two-component response regulator